MAEVRIVDNQTEPLESVILSAFQEASVAQVATAFVKRSGINRISAALERFLLGGGEAHFIYGLDFHITDPDAISAFVDFSGRYPALLHHAYSEWGLSLTQAFHPKLYLFRRPDGESTAIVGSSNLTAGGISRNSEANAVITGGAEDPAIVQAGRVFERIRLREGLFAPSEGWLTRYREIYGRAQRVPIGEKPPKEIEAEYLDLKWHEQQLPGVIPTQRKVVIEAIKSLVPGPDGFVHISEIVAEAERIARAASADFDWRTFANSVRGRLNENTIGTGGDDLFERKGGIGGREGRYRLTDKGREYKGR